MRRIDTAERRARLGLRHLLADPGDDPVAVANAVVALHSSDPASVYLSLQARLPGSFTRADLERALYEERTLLRMLGMRRTMFVVTRDMGAIMDAACTRLLAPGERRRLAKLVTDQCLADEGELWVDDVCDATMAALEARSEAVATELREDVPELRGKISFGEGKTWAGEAGVSTRVLFLLATEGRVIRARPRGTWLSSQYRWAPTEVWLGEPLPELETAPAQAELLRRWLLRFGPGTLTDLRWWTGWTVRDTKAALDTVGAVEVELDEGIGYVLPDDVDTDPDTPSWAALLPGLDPTPMGWKERAWFLGDHGSQLFDRNGNVGPTVWVDGRIVGAWAQDSTGTVSMRLLEDVTAEQQGLIDERRDQLDEWLAGDRVSPRFRTPLERAIAEAE